MTIVLLPAPPAPSPPAPTVVTGFRQAASYPAIPKFAYPFTVRDGTAVVVEQDSADEYAGCVEVIVRTPRGQFTEIPDLGVGEQAFLQGGADIEGIAGQIAAYEPRADVALVGDAQNMDDFIDRVRIEVDDGAEA